MYDEVDDPYWDYAWTRPKVRGTRIQHFAELDAVDHVPDVQVGSSCYDCPDGTNDHEGESHE